MSQNPRKEILKGFLTKKTPQREEFIAFIDQDLRDEDVEEVIYLFKEVSKDGEYWTITTLHYYDFTGSKIPVGDKIQEKHGLSVDVTRSVSLLVSDSFV